MIKWLMQQMISQAFLNFRNSRWVVAILEGRMERYQEGEMNDQDLIF